jgi:hypothetical protein
MFDAELARLLLISAGAMVLLLVGWRDFSQQASGCER